jgi:hypothetical protein
MSDEPRDRGSTGNALSAYDVGYGKPPATHQFAKGKSGNPRGRPRRPKPARRELNPNNRPTDSLVLEEAYRMVSIREGDKIIELPAVQAAVRSLAIAAMKGSRLSQKALAELVRGIENHRATEQYAVVETLFEYKHKWTNELDRRKHLGIMEPDPVPHPDDIIVNLRTGEFRIEGPADAHEKARYDEMIARRAEAQTEVSDYAGRYRRSRAGKHKTWWLKEWLFEQRIFDIINDSLPKRYKLKLENRSYAEGASREGKTLEEVRKNRALRQEYVEG